MEEMKMASKKNEKVTEDKEVKKTTKRKTTTRKRNVRALTIVKEPERYAKDEKTKSLHKTFTIDEVHEMAENAETSYEETSYVDGITQTDMDWIRENTDPKNIKTPSEYFKYIKNMTNGVTNESILAALKATQEVLKTCVVTGQKNLAASFVTKFELLVRERNAIEHGFTQVVNRTDLEAWVVDIATQAKTKNEPNPIHIIELKRYERVIPDDVIDKIDKARNYFDMLYVAYTDYTGETVRKVEKEKRDKDPIIFGAFLTKTENGNMMPSEHLFFIADWVDEYCDLTMDQLIKSYKKETKENIVLPEEIFTTTDIEDIKKQLKEM